MPAPRFLAWGRRVAIGLICFHVCLWPWELYRRIWQVLRADLLVSSEVLTPGTTISIDVVTSGEVRNRIMLELVQDGRRETLLEFHGELNRMNVYDVRTYRYTHTVTLTSDVLAGFKPGPASVELTGYGGTKLLRTPAPVVRRQRVMVLTGERPSALSQRGAELAGEVVRYEDAYRLCYIRGPEGLSSDSLKNSVERRHGNKLT